MPPDEAVISMTEHTDDKVNEKNNLGGGISIRIIGAVAIVIALALAFFAFSFQVFLPGLNAQNAPSTRPTPAVAATETVSTPSAATTTSPNDYPAQL